MPYDDSFMPQLFNLFLGRGACGVVINCWLPFARAQGDKDKCHAENCFVEVSALSRSLSETRVAYMLEVHHCTIVEVVAEAC